MDCIISRQSLGTRGWRLMSFRSKNGGKICGSSSGLLKATLSVSRLNIMLIMSRIQGRTQGSLGPSLRDLPSTRFSGVLVKKNLVRPSPSENPGCVTGSINGKDINDPHQYLWNGSIGPDSQRRWRTKSIHSRKGIQEQQERAQL